MAGQRIGVLAGTTTEEALRNTLSDAGIVADVVAAKTHGEGLAMLDDGKISAYFADRSILATLSRDSKAPGKLRLADEYLTVEPYALALPRGDSDFRLAVDRALSHIYRSGDIIALFERTFGGLSTISRMPYAVRDFFLNGGTTAIVVRLFRELAPDETTKTRMKALLEGITNKADDAAVTICPSTTKCRSERVLPGCSVIVFT